MNMALRMACRVHYRLPLRMACRVHYRLPLRMACQVHYMYRLPYYLQLLNMLGQCTCSIAVTLRSTSLSSLNTNCFVFGLSLSDLLARSDELVAHKRQKSLEEKHWSRRLGHLRGPQPSTSSSLSSRQGQEKKVNRKRGKQRSPEGR